MKNIILTIIFSTISSLSIAQKAFDEFVVTKNFVPFQNFTAKALPTANTTATVTINTSTVINPINQALFGQNAAAFQGNTVVTGNREQNWKNAKFSFVRYPGGNWSNRFFWDGQTPATIKVENEMGGDVSQLFKGNTGWMLGTSEFPSLLNLMGSKGIVCVNVGYAFYGTSADPVETAAQYAANWVKYYNIDLNAGIKYWELGNENYGPWQAGFSLGSPQKYAQACLVFSQKMKAIDPTIKIGVVLYEGDGGFNQPQGKNWNELVLPIVQDIMDYAIIHHYPHPNSNKNAISEKNIYDAVSVVGGTVATMQRQTTTYTNKPAGYYPIAITEFNARTGVREISRTNALFTTMMLGEYAKYKDYAAAMQWDLENGYDVVNGGTHGSVADSDPFMIDGDAYPSLLAHYYMRQYFGDKLVSSSSTDVDIVVYPTTFASGETGIVLINKGATEKNVQINGGNAFTKDDRIFWHTINGDASDFDRTLYINEQGPSTTFNVGQTYTNGANSAVATQFEANGVGGPRNYTTIAPFSAVLPTNSGFKFNAKPYSANYIVVAPENNSPTHPAYFIQDFDVSTTLSNYIGSNDNQFNVLAAASGTTSVVNINDKNQLVLNRAANPGLTAARTTDLAVPASGVHQMKFDFLGHRSAALVGTPALQVTGEVHVVLGANLNSDITGTGIPNTVVSGIPNNAGDSYLQLKFTISKTEDSTYLFTYLKPDGTFATNSPNYKGLKTIRYVMNTKGNDISYPDPVGNAKILRNNKFDLYVDNNLVYDNQDLTKASIIPKDFKISFSAGNLRGIATFDNILYNAASNITDVITTPVKLTSFKGKTLDNAIVLEWTTASEQNSSHFEVLHSQDGKQFSKIGSVQSAGNSSSINHYTFVDKEPNAAENYYQLKQIDKDGAADYSDIIVVTSILQKSGLMAFATSMGVSLNIYAEKADRSKIILSNINGQQIAAENVVLSKGYNNLNINAALQPGIYIVSMQLNGKKFTYKFIKP